ncbi:MAG: hypothetical protein A2046_14095 [Bacteroidetes bacterium GWA2_30_7]|nr:MAG: hypothetical protein A2046_14095 [Bacteroidetes bacterium GWA2_30_7]
MGAIKILVVDDEPGNISVVADILEKYNYEIIAAYNGNIAFQVAKKQIPDLILMDWDMPIMNGLDSIKILKKDYTTKDIPVIMISGIMISSENLKTAFDAGAIDYVRKPIDELELISRIRSMLMLSMYYKETINLKNRELTTAAMKLIKANEYDSKLIERLKEIKENITHCEQFIDEKLNDLIHEVFLRKKENSWLQFEEYFKMVNPEFNFKLLSNHPELTPAEIKLCTLLRLNINTKDISSILSLSQESIRVSRTRLRKKLNLESSVNLVGYLLAI